MKLNWAMAVAAGALLIAPVAAQADSISSVENARAKERQGRWLSSQDREKLRRYGGNDDYRSRYQYDSYGYSSGNYGYSYESGYPGYRSYRY